MPYLDDADRIAVGALGDPIRVWGSTPARQDRNDKARALAERRPGDLLFFAADRTFIARARIAHLVRSPELAESIWGRDQDGRTWEHVVFLTEVEMADRRSAPLLEPLGLRDVVHGLTLLSAARSRHFLRAWENEPLRTDEAYEILRTLTGETLTTVTGRENRILAVDAKDVLVATSKTPDGAPVPVADVQRGLDLLRDDGVVNVHVDELGYRSAFVGAVLLRMPGASAAGPPWRVRTFGDADLDAATEATAEVRVRLEQERLRRIALGGADSAPCALCGETFLAAFLVAAHIKRRSECTQRERNDVRNVVMLACVFGCDVLYERGWISVDATGAIVMSPSTSSLEGRVAEHIARLEGRRCSAFRPDSEAYFAHHFRTLRP